MKSGEYDDHLREAVVLGNCVTLSFPTAYLGFRVLRTRLVGMGIRMEKTKLCATFVAPHFGFILAIPTGE